MRDYSIDFFKGLCTIGIIFIHTVWWSGSNYVPNIIAQFSLFLDVPLFFFLSGASATFSFKKQKPFSGLIRLLHLFLLFYLAFSLIVNNTNILNNLLEVLFMQYPLAPHMEVVQGSTWFIPVFFIVYFLSYLIIKHIDNRFMPLILASFMLFLYKTSDSIIYPNLSFLSVNSSYIFTYLFLFLFGYYYFDKLKTKKWIQYLGLFIFIASYTILYFYTRKNPLDLQLLKFPPNFYYVIASLLSIAITIIFSRYIKKDYWINYLGRNALYLYLAQGISSSILYLIVYRVNLEWKPKLLLLFSINLVISILISIIIKYIFEKYSKLLSYLNIIPKP